MILAKRIMDKGTANHILISKHIVPKSNSCMKTISKFIDMGECIVKLRKKIGVFSFIPQDENHEIGSTAPINSKLHRQTKQV